MDSYFAITDAQPPLIYHYLNTIFTDEAATWFHYNFNKTDPSNVTWAAVKTPLLEYFVQPNHLRRLRDQWADARQTGTVTEFHTYLARIAMQLANINEDEFLHKFIRGLKSNTRTELEFRDPKTITDAVKWADTFDSRDSRYYQKKNNQHYYGSFSPSSTYQHDNRGEPMQIDLLRTNSDKTLTPIRIDTFKTKSQLSLGKLSDKERIHLRTIGACFKCRKQGHMACECPSKTYNNSKNMKRQ